MEVKLRNALSECPAEGISHVGSTAIPRDHMGERSQIARACETPKLGLWKRFGHDRDVHTDAKTKFIRKLIGVAKADCEGRYRRIPVLQGKQSAPVGRYLGDRRLASIYLSPKGRFFRVRWCGFGWHHGAPGSVGDGGGAPESSGLRLSHAQARQGEEECGEAPHAARGAAIVSSAAPRSMTSRRASAP